MARRQQEENDGQWHLDKRVPLALIIAIVVQTGGAFWWASGVSSSITNAQAAISRLEAADKENVSRFDRLTRVETKLEAVADVLRRLENGIERLGRPSRR